MARTKFDGVIEAVRCAPDGRLAIARVYERRGAVWSDEFLLERKDLVQRLKQGKRFVIGTRKAYLGGVFDVGKPVRLIEDQIVTDERPNGREVLAGVPIF